MNEYTAVSTVKPRFLEKHSIKFNKTVFLTTLKKIVLCITIYLRANTISYILLSLTFNEVLLTYIICIVLPTMFFRIDKNFNFNNL